MNLAVVAGRNEDESMRSAIVLKLAAAVAVGTLHGCTDLKPIEERLDNLQSQIGKLQSDLRAARAAADQALSSTQATAQEAAGARSAANQALAAAQAAQSAADATNEKIDRMFKRTPSQ